MNTTDNKKTVIHCKRADDIPKEKHWAILETQTGTERGYDRGDPDVSFNYVSYTAYLVKEEWEKEITRRIENELKSSFSSRSKFRAMEVSPATVNTTVTVKIDSHQG